MLNNTANVGQCGEQPKFILLRKGYLNPALFLTSSLRFKAYFRAVKFFSLSSAVEKDL